MEVLEIGCGTGSIAITHAPYVKHIRAIDFSQNMMAIAQDKADVAPIHNMPFEKVVIEDFMIPEHSLGALLGLNILHLLEYKIATISKAYQTLKTVGIFVISMACLGDIMSWPKFMFPIGRFLGAFLLVTVFMIKDLDPSLTDAGFTLDYP